MRLIHVSPTAPVFVKVPTNKRAKVGDDVLLEVVVDGKPAPEVQWLTPGGPANMLYQFEVCTALSLIHASRFLTPVPFFLDHFGSKIFFWSS